ncbi:MAG: DUF2807 domain-containing protein [Candidatus Bathyarchaeota archaeon]|nr:DUF2807 domain-containing protein [Candidatus Bathyarchaeota archaeon]
MGYCWKCGSKLDEGMAYCPKCGAQVKTPSANASQPPRHESRPIGWVFGIAVVAVLAAVVVIFVALIAVGVLPILTGPFNESPSGNLQTQQMDLSGFYAVDAGYGFDVTIKQGSNYSVSVTTNENMMQYIDAKVVGQTLQIGVSGIHWPSTLKAEITMPDLTAVSLSGGAKANVSGFNLTHNLNVDLSGGSRVTMTGQATALTAEGSGGSNLMLQNLMVNGAAVDLSGGSQGTVYVDGELNANLSGGSHLSYRGNTVLGNINTSGGASATKVP